MTDQEREGLERNTGPHDDAIPGPTDDTYKDSELTDLDRALDPDEEVLPDPDDAGGTHRQKGQGKASPDELADDPGRRRFDYS